jgi:GxxExxY protein
MHDNNQPLYVQLTETILGCCFDVMNELGSGFLESVYKNEKGLSIEAEKRFEVIFRGRKIGLYIADNCRAEMLRVVTW